jgi:alpha-tubulin suppressor-like RCC1 family protein
VGAAVTCLLLLAAVVSAAPAVAAEPGTPLAWGGNTYGQLGDGSTSAHQAPAPVTGIDDAIDIAGGREHAVALRPDGRVWTWGHNSFGQLGDGTIQDRTLPTLVTGINSVVDVSTGHYHTLAIRSDGTAWGWGYNALGQLGDGTTTNRRVPVRIGSLTNVVELAGGRSMSYAILGDGTLWAWGTNADGQLGDGTTTRRLTPVRVGTLSNIVSVAGGRDHGLAVRGDGTVWAWGDNAYGQLGDGTLTDRLSPIQVPGITDAISVIAGAHHSVALRATGTVLTWGRNNLGQLGDGTTTQRRSPTAVAGLNGVVGLGAGRDHTLAVLGDGSLRAWGLNDFRQLGDGTTTNRTRPVVVTGAADVADAHGGRDYSIILEAGTTTDTIPPNPGPGKPAGVSNSHSTIDLTWTAAADETSTTLTYQVFRDGSQVGSFTSSSITTVSFQDTNLAPASTHTYTVVARDQANNAATSPASDPITTQSAPPPDTTPPNPGPGKPSGVSNSPSTIDLTWTAAADETSTTLTYQVFRDGSQVGSFTSSSTTTVSFHDTNLAPASTHAYTVVARDQANNAATSPASDPITTQSAPPPTAIFSDDLSSGGFSNWTGVTRFTIDTVSGNPAAPSARASAASQTATMTRALGSTYSNLCLSARVNMSSRTGTMVLWRLRTAASGPVARAFLTSTGALAIRSDVSGTQILTSVALGTGWHTVELCGAVGAAGAWNLYRDGVRIVTGWTANTGTTPIGAIEIGSAVAGTFTANWDDIVVDQTPG